MQALESLCRIYEQEREWEKAIDAGQRLEILSGRSLALQIAHYYCERAELAAAEKSFEAQSILLLSLLQRIRDRRITFDESDLGDIAAIAITEREFAVLEPHLAIRDGDRWVYVEGIERTEDGPRATLCWPLLFCHGCDTELEARRDPDDTNDQWRVRCCGEEALGNSIAELNINWNQWRSRFFRDFRDA